MAPVQKSFRLDEDLNDKLGKDSNFSNIANQAIKEYLNKTVWIPNFEIEKHAGLSATQVIERVENVNYLRQSESAMEFTFYPTSEDEIKCNKNIYDYANGNFNAIHDRYIYFNIEFPVDFLLFLKSRQWEDVERSVHGFLSLLHFADPENQNYLEEQLERKTLRAVVKIMKSENFQRMETLWKKHLKSHNKKLRAEFCDLYLKTITDLGIDPILFPYMTQILRIIRYPFPLSDKIFGGMSEFGIKLTAAYMRDVYEEKDDWRSIVVSGTRKDDSLQRAESSSIPWKIWLDEYTFYHDDELAKK